MRAKMLIVTYLRVACYVDFCVDACAGLLHNAAVGQFDVWVAGRHGVSRVAMFEGRQIHAHPPIGVSACHPRKENPHQTDPLPENPATQHG